MSDLVPHPWDAFKIIKEAEVGASVDALVDEWLEQMDESGRIDDELQELRNEKDGVERRIEELAQRILKARPDWADQIRSSEDPRAE